MKVLSSTLAATVLFACAVSGAAAAPVEQGENVGHSSLPAGKYILTNLETGHSIYVDIGTRGRMTGKLPQAAIDQLKNEATAKTAEPAPAPAATAAQTTGEASVQTADQEPVTFNLKDLFKNELGKALQGKDAQKFMEKLNK